MLNSKDSLKACFENVNIMDSRWMQRVYVCIIISHFLSKDILLKVPSFPSSMRLFLTQV